jgi:NADH-quinone oxidoreductase subunit H
MISMKTFIISILIKSVIVIISILVAVAYYTLLERQLMGILQRRKGPLVVGYLGLLQPLADGLKLFVKEIIVPSSSNKILFILAPILFFFLSLLPWTIMPYSENFYVCNMNFTLLYLLTISSLSVYGIILSGWASNSNYAFLGCLRSTAQMISYEISISFIIISICLNSQSFNLIEIIEAQKYIWNIFPFFPLFFLFVISILAETNRHPFDLPEAESELVSGYNVEYSAITFAFFSLGEYANILTMSIVTTHLFLGGWYFFGFKSWIFVIIKTLLFSLIFIILRAILPRYRYDQLMSIGWTIILPLSLLFLFYNIILFKFYLCPEYINYATTFKLELPSFKIFK